MGRRISKQSSSAKAAQHPTSDTSRPQSRHTRRIITGCVIAVVLGFGGWYLATKIQARYWARKGAQSVASRHLRLADECYRKADAIDRGRGQYLVGRARVARLQFQFDRAREILQQIPAIGDDKTGVSRERLLVEIQDTEARNLFDQFERLKDQRPDDVDAVWQAYVVGLASNGDQTLAAELASKWLVEQPDSPIANSSNGELAYDREEYQSASEFFSRAIKLDPNLKDAWQGLARVAYHELDYRNALRYDKKLLAIDPLDSEARLRRAQSLIAIHRDQEAIAEFESVLELHQENFTARYGLALLLIEHDQPKRAIELIEPFLSAFADDISINYMIANAYANLEDAEAAEPYLQKHLDARKEVNRLQERIGMTPPDQRNFSFCKSIGLGYLKYQWDLAYDWLEQAMSLNPMDPDIHQALGEFASKRGDRELAAKYHQQAEQLRRMLVPATR